jgi:hypothetical protein
MRELDKTNMDAGCHEFICAVVKLFEMGFDVNDLPPLFVLTLGRLLTEAIQDKYDEQNHEEFISRIEAYRLSINLSFDVILTDYENGPPKD